MSEITGETRVIGVLGYPVGHSRSPAMHNVAIHALGLPYVYVPFEVAPDKLETAMRGLASLGVVGVNLTIPHKEAALSLVDEPTSEAVEVGAVNTIHFVQGRIVGDNTDGYGFYKPLELAGICVKGEATLVLGAGGAARSVVFKLAREGAHVTIANRTRDRAESLANSVKAAGYNAPEIVDWDSLLVNTELVANSMLIVNTTRIGMRPEINGCPELPFEALGPSQVVYDLVYNPTNTVLLRRSAERGCRVVDGVKMLVYQGAASFERWTGVSPPVDAMEQAVLRGLI